MGFEKSPATNDYWTEFTTATGKVAADYTVVAFGDTAAMADELLALVISGEKRATASLLRDVRYGSKTDIPRPSHLCLLSGVKRPLDA